MTDAAPKERSRRSSEGQPWPVAAALHVLERYGVSTLALGALAWFTATYMIRPLVGAATASMESVAEKVGQIEEIFRESERMERDQAARATAAIETIKTEISAHRQQAVEMRDGLLSRVLDAQSREFARNRGDMERILRESLHREDRQAPVKGVIAVPASPDGQAGGG